MGYWTMVMAGGPVLGVVVGGPVVETFTWRWIFIAQVPLTILAVLVAYAVLPATEKIPGVRFDLSGALALTASVTLALIGLNQGPSMGWDTLVIGSFALAPLALLLFIRIERRVSEPLIPLDYFRRRNFALPHRRRLLPELRLHGWVHPHAAAAPGGLGLRGDPRWAVLDRPATDVRRVGADRRLPRSARGAGVSVSSARPPSCCR